MSASIIAIVNRKGGCSKTTTAVNLGIGLVREGKRVLLVDADPQASMTISLGIPHPDNLSATITNLMFKAINGSPIARNEVVLHHPEGVDLLPANALLSGVEVALTSIPNRHAMLKQVLAAYQKDYDHILIDCGPSLGLLTVNALTAANRVIIPVQAQYLSVKGLEELLRNIRQTTEHINPRLKIDGILITMLDSRTKFSKEIASLMYEMYGRHIKIFTTTIPRSVRAAEASARGRSIFAHDPYGRVSRAYRELTKEVLTLEAKRQRAKSEMAR